MQKATLDEDDDDDDCDAEDSNDETDCDCDDEDDDDDDDEDDESDEESSKKITPPVCTLNLTSCRAFQFSTQYIYVARDLLGVGNFLEILWEICQKLKF